MIMPAVAPEDQGCQRATRQRYESLSADLRLPMAPSDRNVSPICFRGMDGGRCIILLVDRNKPFEMEVRIRACSNANLTPIDALDSRGLQHRHHENVRLPYSPAALEANSIICADSDLGWNRPWECRACVPSSAALSPVGTEASGLGQRDGGREPFPFSAASRPN